MKAGLHGRNESRFTGRDFEVFNRARIETAVMMSFTENAAFDGLRGFRPDMQFIVRLYHRGIGTGGPVPQEVFVEDMSPDIARLQRYTDIFQIHCEPNHHFGVEGWGSSDGHAHNFAHWYKHVLRMLKDRFPWAKFGFPGLALNHPHRDFAWLRICREQIEASHWLGCHCYWQYDNMWNENWGFRFTHYHNRFPDHEIHITEFGDSTPGLSDEAMANQYVEYYNALQHYDYLGSASSFIASSPDPTWAPFCWTWENGIIRQVVDKVGNR